MLYSRGEIAGKVFLLVLLGFILIPAADATTIGVTPASYNTVFEPNSQQSFKFNFYVAGNSGLKISVTGDLAEYVALSDDYLENSGEVIAFIKFPKEIEIPGMHKIRVGALEDPKDKAMGMGIIGNVLGSINVFIPYPGKYIETEFNAKDVKYGEVEEMALKILNKGTEDSLTNSRVEVYDANDKLVEKIELGENLIESMGTKDLVARFDTLNQKIGKYKAVSIVQYHGKESRKEQIFRVGELFIDIKGYTKEFVRGKINKFEIEIESLWNDGIENVFAEVIIPNYNIRFLTPSVNLAGFERANLTGYFDTTSIPVELDKFRASMYIKYAGRTTQKQVYLKIKGEFDYVLYCLIGIIVLLALILAVIVVINIRSYEKLKKVKRYSKKNEKRQH